jgi:hypothetical protein
MILNFEDEMGERHFQFCFVGFVLGGSLQQTKGMQVLRTEVAIFEKLESISELKPCGKKMINGEPERELMKEGQKQLQLSMPEFDLMFSYIAQVPWQTGTPSRNAVDTLDWLTLSSKPNGDTRSKHN